MYCGSSGLFSVYFVINAFNIFLFKIYQLKQSVRKELFLNHFTYNLYSLNGNA